VVKSLRKCLQLTKLKFLFDTDKTYFDAFDLSSCQNILGDEYIEQFRAVDLVNKLWTIGNENLIELVFHLHLLSYTQQNYLVNSVCIPNCMYILCKNKSSSKSFGNSASLPLTAENALIRCMCWLCNVHCRQVKLLSRRYATSIPHQSHDISVIPLTYRS